MPARRKRPTERLLLLAAAVAAALVLIGMKEERGPAGDPQFADSGAEADAAAVWGQVDCESGARHRHFMFGGDPRFDLEGGVVGTTAFRRLTVFDGDDVYGERCELGLNDWRNGPTALYREGKRRVTSLSLRLPGSFPLRARGWQTVMQMKQAQPSDGGGSSPVIELLAHGGRWRLSVATQRRVDDWTRWSAPARKGVWTRFVFDIVYSRNPRVGRVLLRVDLNGDGDTADRRERAGPFRGTTLKREPAEAGYDDGIRAGASIPSHLRVGVYHDPRIPCPRGCAIDVDHVRIRR